MLYFHFVIVFLRMKFCYTITPTKTVSNAMQPLLHAHVRIRILEFECSVELVAVSFLDCVPGSETALNTIPNKRVGNLINPF